MLPNVAKAGVGLGHHTDEWFERQNRLTGQPRGARHSDEWYQTHQTAAAPPPPPTPPPPGQWLPGQGPPAANPQHDYQAFLSQAQQLNPQFNVSFEQYQAALARGGLTGLTGYQMATMSTAQFQQYMGQVQQAAAQAPPSAGNTPEELAEIARQQKEHAAYLEAERIRKEQEAAAAAAAAEADKQKKMWQRRDDWDAMNKQGIHDPDGWQSIGIQPDPIAMPDWWRDAVAPPAPPVVTPSPAPPAVTPPPAPPAPPAATLNSLQASPPVAPSGTNALAQALAPPEASTGTPAGQGWGAWGQAPNFNSVPATTQGPQSWTQPAGQTKATTPWGSGPTGPRAKPKPWQQPKTWGSPQQPKTWGL